VSPHIKLTTCGPFARKLARAAALALAVLCLLGGASREAAAQRVQDGPKLVGSGVDGAIAAQGTSVAVSADGNTAIVGGPFDGGSNGAAWVFIQNNGAWTQQQKLVGSNGAGSDQGTSVALSADGNTAIVGGPHGAGGLYGAAWVYTRTKRRLDRTADADRQRRYREPGPSRQLGRAVGRRQHRNRGRADRQLRS
jgi:hypothetical protein